MPSIYTPWRNSLGNWPSLWVLQTTSLPACLSEGNAGVTSSPALSWFLVHPHACCWWPLPWLTLPLGSLSQYFIWVWHLLLSLLEAFVLIIKPGEWSKLTFSPVSSQLHNLTFKVEVLAYFLFKAIVPPSPYHKARVLRCPGCLDSHDWLHSLLSFIFFWSTRLSVYELLHNQIQEETIIFQIHIQNDMKIPTLPRDVFYLSSWCYNSSIWYLNTG